jgi:nucleotide-binding universal stress UspA family protein
MYAHFLVPTDGSKLSDKAIAQAIALAKSTQARITFFHGTPGFPRPVYADGVSVEMVTRRDYQKRTKEDAQKVLDRAAAKAKAAGIACNTIHATTDAPWEAILAAAKKAKADTIVMARTVAAGSSTSARQRDDEGAHAQHLARVRSDKPIPLW